MTKKVFAVALYVILISGCGTKLKKEAQYVQMIQGEIPSSCAYRGSVTGSFSWGMDTHDDMIGARNELFNNTASLGGNYVKVTSHHANAMTNKFFGEAYYCNSNQNINVDHRNYEADPALVSSQMESFSKAGQQISNSMAERYKAPQPSYVPPKQIDYTCLNRCQKSGYMHEFCTSKCEY